MTRELIITTPAQANALPFRTYLMGRDGFRHEKQGLAGADSWLMVVEGASLHRARDIEYPAKVLYVPIEDE